MYFEKAKKKEIKFPLFDPSTSFYDLSDFENDCNKNVFICATNLHFFVILSYMRNLINRTS